MREKPLSRLLALLAALAALLTGCSGGPRSDPGTVSETMPSAEAQDTLTGLNVYCFQAGKADAFLLWNDAGAVLLDTGESGFGKTITDKLEALGIRRLDVLILTHFDKDHVGGAKKILDSVPVDRILQSNCPKPGAKAYEKYCSAVEALGLEPETVRQTLTFRLGDVSFTVDPPAREQYAEDPSNNSSLIVTVRHGANRLLFTGDALDPRLQEYLASGAEAVSFVKLPHHGSYLTSLRLLLERTCPTYALITSSDQEPEEEETCLLLKEAGVELFLTRKGPVLLQSDGRTLLVRYV